MTIKLKSISAIFLITITTILSGCGGADIPELGTVTGKVMMNGQPIVGIDVVAYPQEGRPGFGKTDENGDYEIMFKRGIAGTKVGSTRVTPTWTNGGPTIPKEYTEMMFDVKAGANTFDFDMKSDAPIWNGIKPKEPKKPKKPIVD